MTSREIADNLMRGERAERVGLLENIWGDTLAAWVQQGYPTRVAYKEQGEQRWREDGRTVEAEQAGEYQEPVPPWEHFGFDMVGVGPWMDIEPLRGYSEVVEENDAWEVKRNGAGAARKFWKHKSGTPEHIDFRMTTRDIWERDYRPYLLDLDLERIKVNELRKNHQTVAGAQRWSFYGHMFIWESMRQSLGDVTLYQSLLLDPAWIHDYNRVYTDFYKKHFAYMIEQCGRPDGIWIYEDLGYKNGLFASPQVLRELIFPYFKELVAFFHTYDLPVVLHSCGSQAQALPLIIEAGFDGLNPMERKAKDNDPFVFAEKYGDRLAFVGGLDVRIFETNDKDLIRKEVAAYIQGMKQRGARLVFASDHSIPPTVRLDTYQFIVDVYRENMLYA